MTTLTFASLGTTLAIDVGICICIVTLFNCLRTLKLTKKFYSPKRYLYVPFRYRPPKLSASFFTWWTPLFKMSEQDMLACAGQDAVTYINFLTLALKMTVVVGLLSMLVLIPVNAAAGSNITCSTDESGQEVCSTPEGKDYSYVDYTTLANIETKSSLLWVHTAAVFVISAIVLKMLWKAQKHAVELRVEYLASTRGGAQTHTILVQNIPGTRAGTVNQRIYDNMDGTLGKLLPKSVKERAKSAVEGGLAKGGGLGAHLPGHAATDSARLEPPNAYLSPRSETMHSAESGSRNFDSARSLSLGSGRLPASDHSFDGARWPDEHSAQPPPPPPQPTAPQGALGAQSAFDRNHAGQSRADEISDVALDVRARSGADDDAADDFDAERFRRHYMDLGNREQGRRPTDFSAWAQAEAALQAGLSLEQLVEREFARTYTADAVERVTMVKDVGDVEVLFKKYDGVRVQLESLVDKWGSRMIAGKPIKHATKSVKPRKLGQSAVEQWGPDKLKVDKTEHLVWQLNDLYQKIQDAQQTAMGKDSSAAFVTFRRRLTQVQAADALHHHDKTYWHTEPASGPQEIVWSNLTFRGWERSIRFILAWSLFTLMTLFYTIPVVAIQAFLQVKYLEKLPGSDLLLDNVVIRSLIAGILPGLALALFLALVPKLLRWFNVIQGMYSEAAIDFGVGRSYYIFLYTQVFVVTVVGSSLITSFKQLTEDSSGFLRSLGETIPTTAAFYMSYTLVNALISLPIKLLNVVPLVIFALKASMAGSARGRRRIWARQYTAYGPDLPLHSLTLLFALVFSVMYPLIAIPCIIYFMVSCFVARYQLLYVFREAYQSGGRFQPVIYDQIVVALMSFQIVMFATLSVKEFPFSPLLLIPIVGTLIYNALAASTFNAPLGNLSAHAAADLDRADKAKRRDNAAAHDAELMRVMDCEDTPLGRVEELYLPRCLTLSRSEHENTLDGLEHARSAVAAVEAGGEVPEDMRAAALDEDEDDHSDHVVKDTIKDLKITRKGKNKQVQSEV